MTTNQPDLIEEFKGKVQELRRNQEASDRRASQNARRAARAALDAHQASEEHLRTQETVQRLTGALDSARLRLEKMHIPGCLRIGYDCPACEGLDDLDSY